MPFDPWLAQSTPCSATEYLDTGFVDETGDRHYPPRAMSSPPQRDPYYIQTWAKHDVWTKLSWGALIIPGVISILIGVLTATGAFLPCLGIWILFWTVQAISTMSGKRCPRCGKTFYSQGWVGHNDGFHLSQKCVNCGLPFGAINEHGDVEGP